MIAFCWRLCRTPKAPQFPDSVIGAYRALYGPDSATDACSILLRWHETLVKQSTQRANDASKIDALTAECEKLRARCREMDARPAPPLWRQLSAHLKMRAGRRMNDLFRRLETRHPHQTDVKGWVRFVKSRRGRKILSERIGRMFTRSEGAVIADMLATDNKDWERFRSAIRKDPKSYMKYFGE